VECVATADCWFSILAAVMCLETLVEIWWPIWSTYSVPHECRIL
jgi:hypothetical protein